jgi:hypothetical protein
VTRLVTERTLLLCLLTLAIGYVAYATQYDFGGVRRPGVGFVPVLAGLASVVVAGVLLLQVWIRSPAPHRGDASLKPAGEPTEEDQAGAAMAALVVFAALHAVVGFWVSVLGTLAALFRIAGVRTWAGALVGAAVGTALSYLVFAGWLGGQFPGGWLR